MCQSILHNSNSKALLFGYSIGGRLCIKGNTFGDMYHYIYCSFDRSPIYYKVTIVVGIVVVQETFF